MSKVWLVTHTNLSGEKCYWKVKADSRKEAKEKVSEKHGVYLFMLTAVRGEKATIHQTMFGTYIVQWEGKY